MMKWTQWSVILVGAVILGALWYYKHSTCPTCQHKAAAMKLSLTQWKRRIGMRIIE